MQVYVARCSDKSQIWFCSKQTHWLGPPNWPFCKKRLWMDISPSPLQGTEIVTLLPASIHLDRELRLLQLSTVFSLNSLLNQFSWANFSAFACSDLGGLTPAAWPTTSGLTHSGGGNMMGWFLLPLTSTAGSGRVFLFDIYFSFCNLLTAWGLMFRHWSSMHTAEIV